MNKTIESLKKWEKKLREARAATISDACEIIGISRTTYRNWTDANNTLYWPQFAELVPDIIEEHRQENIDAVEKTMFITAMEGNVAAAKFILERLRKNEFGQNIDLHADDNTIKISFG